MYLQANPLYREAWRTVRLTVWLSLLHLDSSSLTLTPLALRGEKTLTRYSIMERMPRRKKSARAGVPSCSELRQRDRTNAEKLGGKETCIRWTDRSNEDSRRATHTIWCPHFVLPAERLLGFIFFDDFVLGLFLSHQKNKHITGSPGKYYTRWDQPRQTPQLVISQPDLSTCISQLGIVWTSEVKFHVGVINSRRKFAKQMNRINGEVVNICSGGSKSK